MATTIIIGGSNRAHAAIENANQDASNWTQAEKDQMAQKFNDFADQVDVMRSSFNKS